MIKKQIIHLYYCIKSIIKHPLQTIKEFSSDVKKDRKSYLYKSKNYFVWCAGLPKSGTALIEKIFEHLPYVPMKYSLKRIYAPIHLDHEHGVSKAMFSNIPQRKYTFLKTHTHYSENYEKIGLNKNAKIIISLRDIRDMMISRYYHVLAETTHRHHKAIKDLSFEEGFIKSLKIKEKETDSTPLEVYYYWIYNWIKIANKKKYLILWYENYANSPVEYIQKILNYIDFKEFSAVELQNKIKDISQKRSDLKKNLSNYGRARSTFRSGQINQWKKMFNENISNTFNLSLPKPIKHILNAEK